MKEKTAIIMSGGGMACSYGVGAILALVEKYSFTKPDIIIAGSGSAGTLSYFVAGQYESIKNIWSNLLSTKKFIDPFRFSRMIDIDYLIDEVFKKQDVLNVEKIYNSQISCLIPAVNCETGEIRYFSNIDRDDIFEAMRATKAMPILFNKKVYIDGERYCDSYASASIKLNALKAIEMGAKKIIIIDNDTPNRINEIFFSAWLRLKNNKFRQNYQKNMEKIRNYRLPDDLEIVYLKPVKKLEISTLNNNRELIMRTIDQGFQETCENIFLREFLS